MKQNEWNEGLNHIDSDLIEEFVEMGERFHAKSTRKSVWLQFGAIAACLCIVISAAVTVPLLLPHDTGVNPLPGETEETTNPFISTPDILDTRLQLPTAAPIYYGSEAEQSNGSLTTIVLVHGMSVTARLKEILPDTYTFFDDWNQTEYGILLMETVTLVRGAEMVDEFYYLIPIDYMTDFTIFDTFLIWEMTQRGYGYSVLYNATQGCAEQFNRVLFGCRYNGAGITAFDENGYLDTRLWQSTEAWIAGTKDATIDHTHTLSKAIEEIQERKGPYDYSVLLGIPDYESEAAEALSDLTSFETGLFVPYSNHNKLFPITPDPLLTATRYINGFRTNEVIRIHEDTVQYSKAQFTQDDLDTLPDLASAVAMVTAAFEAGEITPPHIQNYEELTLNKTLGTGIVGCYAKTEEGVIGLVRVTWRYDDAKYHRYYDDAYYIIEYGADGYMPIDRDALLEIFGDYETDNIYKGKYNETGKIISRTYL